MKAPSDKSPSDRLAYKASTESSRDACSLAVVSLNEGPVERLLNSLSESSQYRRTGRPLRVLASLELSEGDVGEIAADCEGTIRTSQLMLGWH